MHGLLPSTSIITYLGGSVHAALSEVVHLPATTRHACIQGFSRHQAGRERGWVMVAGTHLAEESEPEARGGEVDPEAREAQREDDALVVERVPVVPAKGTREGE